MAITNKELERLIQESQQKFYSWTPDQAVEGNFRCWSIEPFPTTSEDRCLARARKPGLYLGAGCSDSCPRWRHYRAIVEAEERRPRAYPEHRRIHQ